MGVRLVHSEPGFTISTCVHYLFIHSTPVLGALEDLSLVNFSDRVPREVALSCHRCPRDPLSVAVLT